MLMSGVCPGESDRCVVEVLVRFWPQIRPNKPPKWPRWARVAEGGPEGAQGEPQGPLSAARTMQIAIKRVCDTFA